MFGEIMVGVKKMKVTIEAIVDAVRLYLKRRKAVSDTAVPAWTLNVVAEWAFGRFKKNDADACIVVSDSSTIESILESLRKTDSDIVGLFDAAAKGAGKVCIWLKEGECSEVQVLSAKDASVDELKGVMRFDRDGRVREF